MKKRLIVPNRDTAEKVTIEQMFVSSIDISEEDAVICGTGLTASSDFVLCCSHEQLLQVLLEANRHPQGLDAIAAGLRAREYRTYDLQEVVFINNVHLHATVIGMDNQKVNEFLLDSFTVANSDDKDRIWQAYTVQICNEYLCSYFLDSTGRNKMAERPSDSMLLRIAYMEFTKTFPSVTIV